MNTKSAAGAALGIAAAALCIQPAWAALEFLPYLDSGIIWEDNPRYFSDQEKAAAEAINPDITDSVAGTFLEARLQSVYRTPASQIALTPKIRKTNYLDRNTDLNEDNVIVDLASVRAGPRGRIGLNGTWRDISIRTGEFESATPENPNDPPPLPGGGARYAGRVDQEDWSIQPYLSYTLSERNEASIQALLSETRYKADSSDPLGFVGRSYLDYDYATVSVALIHVIDQKTKASLSLNGSSFDASQRLTPFRNQSDTFGLSAALERVFSPTLSGTLEAGLSRSSVDLSGIIAGLDPLTGALCLPSRPCLASSEERNFVGDLGIRQRRERTTLNFNLSRSIAPRSDGTEAVRDQARLYIERDVTRLLKLSLGGIYSQDSSVGKGFLQGSDLPVTLRQDRTYLTIDTGVTWRLTSTLSAYGKYSYVASDTDVASGGSVEEENNRLYFGVTYRGLGIRR